MNLLSGHKSQALALVSIIALTIASAPADAQNSNAAVPGVDPAIVEDLVAANRILAHEGVLDGLGHVSVRHPGNPGRFLMSRNLAPELVNASDIMEFEVETSNPVDPQASRKNNLIKFEKCVLKRDADCVRGEPDRVEVPIACIGAG